MRGGALDQVRGRLLIDHSEVDVAVVDLAEREERGERDAAIAAAEWAIGEEGEEERGHFFGESGIGLAPEGRDLGTLDGVDQTELRFDDAGMRLVAAELRADGAMEVDEVLDGEVADSAVSR